VKWEDVRPGDMVHAEAGLWLVLSFRKTRHVPLAKLSSGRVVQHVHLTLLRSSPRGTRVGEIYRRAEQELDFVVHRKLP